jgi:hypothetical protein
MISALASFAIIAGWAFCLRGFYRAHASRYRERTSRN